MTRNNVFVGDRRVLRRYIGDKLIFDDLADKTEVLSGTEIFTDEVDEEAVVHVEVYGKSWQEGVPSPDSPSEIHSLNDFDVVSSVGKENIILESDYIPFSQGTEETYKGHLCTKIASNTNTNYSKANINFSEESIDGSWYTYSVLVAYQGTKPDSIQLYLNGFHTYTSAEGFDSLVEGVLGRIYATSKASGNSTVARPHLHIRGGDGHVYFTKWKLEKSDKPTNWAPAPEDTTEDTNHPLIDKINLLLDEPLRSIGDVKDRLFRDTDGLWKVERNVGEFAVKGIDVTSISIGLENNVVSTRVINNLYESDYSLPFKSSHYKKMSAPASDWQYISNIGTGTVNTQSRMWLSVNKQTIDTLAKAKIWFDEEYSKGTPVIVNYQQKVNIETLPQPLQDKLNNLRSFKDSNYVYTVLPDKSNILSENLKPTLHSKFKSIGWETFRKKVTKEE